MKTVEMELKNVELGGMSANFGQHGKMRRYVPRQLLVETQSYISARNKMCPRLAVSTGK